MMRVKRMNDEFGFGCARLVRWDEVRRAQVRAELDAYYARLYGLTHDQLRYILDPKEVYANDFPSKPRPRPCAARSKWISPFWRGRFAGSSECVNDLRHEISEFSHSWQ